MAKVAIKFSLVLLGLILISGVGLPVNKAFTQECENDEKTNAAIVENIYQKIKGNKNLASQISHINITSTNLAVKIQGWTEKSSDYDKVQQYALETDCVRVVNVNDFHEEKPENNSLIQMPSGGCSGGTKECGDICIPESDICSIKGWLD